MSEAVVGEFTPMAVMTLLNDFYTMNESALQQIGSIARKIDQNTMGFKYQ
jgi:hypothetical protein